MKKIYISPKTEILTDVYEAQPLMFSGAEVTNPGGGQSGAPGLGFGTGDLNNSSHETFAKKHTMWDFDTDSVK